MEFLVILTEPLFKTVLIWASSAPPLIWIDPPEVIVTKAPFEYQVWLNVCRGYRIPRSIPIVSSFIVVH
ncbi:hypothetical protein D3C86_1131550 [compost metagenome]